MSNKNGKITKLKPRVNTPLPKVIKMPITFAELLRQDKEARKMETEREYARFLEIAPSTLGEYLKGKEPTISILRQVAKKTDYSLRDLFIVAFPEITTADDIDPQWRLLYTRYKNLPQSVQDFIIRALSSLET